MHIKLILFIQLQKKNMELIAPIPDDYKKNIIN